MSPPATIDAGQGRQHALTPAEVNGCTPALLDPNLRCLEELLAPEDIALAELDGVAECQQAFALTRPRAEALLPLQPLDWRPLLAHALPFQAPLPGALRLELPPLLPHLGLRPLAPGDWLVMRKDRHDFIRH